MSPWVLLTAAILSEVAGTSALRASDGFTKPLPVAVMLVTYVFAFYLLSLIVRDVPVGVAYAIWAGAGTALIAMVGVVVFEERLSLLAVAGIAVVIIGIVMIQASSHV